MFIFLPYAALIFLFLHFLEIAGRKATGKLTWQGCFLLAFSLWGAYLILLTEGLSLIKGLSRWPMAGGWAVGFVVILWMGLRSGTLQRGYQEIHSGFRRLSRFEYGLLGVMVFLTVLLLAVAESTPTNNVDAMDYHMPRVMHWVQNRTLAHFPSPHESQNLRPYWAEAVILNFRVLWGNDQLAGLVQWLTMIASVIATSGIAGLLGGDRKAQWLTAVVTFSIPMGLLQSTTTQNDYVSAFWVVCLAYFVILSRNRALSRWELIGLGLSLGLGMLTKGSFFPFAAPLMLWFFLGRLMAKRWRVLIIEGIVLVFLVTGINGFFWSRNIQSTGGPFGSGNPLEPLLRLLPKKSDMPDEGALLTNAMEETPGPMDAASGDELLIQASGMSLPIGINLLQPEVTDSRLAQLAQMVAMNFVSPFSAFNAVYFRFLRTIPGYFPEHWVRSLEMVAWNHEDSAGSPVHFALILLSMGMAGYAAVRERQWYGVIYSLVLVTSYILVSLIGFSSHIFGIRYQLGFFVLGAPLVGLTITSQNKLWIVLSGGLLLYSVPYILISNMRPVIGHTPWPTRVESVFTAKKEDLLFAINPDVQDEYQYFANQISMAGCTRVGLGYARSNQEYQIWYLLDAPSSGVLIQHLVSRPEFEPFKDPDFEPCAVICTICEAIGEDYPHMMVEDYGWVRFYLSTEG